MEEDEVVRDEIEEERRRLGLIEGEEEVGWESPPAGEEEKREKWRGMDRKMEIREERMIEENEEEKREEEREREREDEKREDEKRRSRRGFSGRFKGHYTLGLYIQNIILAPFL